MVAPGFHYSCALLAEGDVRCWGTHFDGIVSEKPIVSLGDVPVVDIEAGGAGYTCALHEDHTVHCWGENASGQLGYGIGDQTVGDDELPGTVQVGGPVDQLVVGCRNTCVRVGDEVKCWGLGEYGTNGYPGIPGMMENLGDDELPSSYGWIDTGFAAPTLGAGCRMVCAYVGPNLRCWGNGAYGSLGYGNTANIGDNETPAEAGNVPYR